jgi:poly(A) polymerase
MPLSHIDPIAARMFAVKVVEKLRQQGYEAVWAGGCVRDQLLDRVPMDYDVATSAHPDSVRELFGRRHTIAIGAAFGVITVIGSKASGNVEVATYRSDSEYIDGRRPVGVTFCNAREDALRRDFTINGLFFDPVGGVVVDYVGGQQDLHEGIIRAIGDPDMRFGEDHLRMLRAVRFSANFEFPLESHTRDAIDRLAHQLALVSPERLAAELRLMFSRAGRGQALRLLVGTGLVNPLFGGQLNKTESFWSSASDALDALCEPSLPLAMAILCREEPESVVVICNHLRLSNHERRLAVWLVKALSVFRSKDIMSDYARAPWSLLQPWLAHEWRFHLADLMVSLAVSNYFSSENVSWVSNQVQRTDAELNPSHLLRGNDLLQIGVPSGPIVGHLLHQLRSLQLDEKITSREAAVEWVEQQCINE